VNNNIESSYTLARETQQAAEAPRDSEQPSNFNSLQITRNNSTDEQEKELQKSISNYSNLLEQQLFLEKHSPNIDSAPRCNLMMSNLSQNEPFQNSSGTEQDLSMLFNKEGSEYNNHKKQGTQKSMLSSKVLRFNGDNF